MNFTQDRFAPGRQVTGLMLVLLFHMALIEATLPEARFIHIVRDGRDVALSMRGQWWGPQSVAQTALWWSQRIRAARSPRIRRG